VFISSTQAKMQSGVLDQWVTVFPPVSLLEALYICTLRCLFGLGCRI